MSKKQTKKTLERNSKIKAKLTYSIRITKGFTVSILISIPKNPAIPLNKCYHSVCSLFLFTFFPANSFNLQHPLTKSLLPLFYRLVDIYFQHLSSLGSPEAISLGSPLEASHSVECVVQALACDVVMSNFHTLFPSKKLQTYFSVVSKNTTLQGFSRIKIVIDKTNNVF